MSQQMDNGASAEKNVAEGSAAIVDQDAVSITSLMLFIFILYLLTFISFLEDASQFP